MRYGFPIGLLAFTMVIAAAACGGIGSSVSGGNGEGGEGFATTGTSGNGAGKGHGGDNSTGSSSHHGSTSSGFEVPDGGTSSGSCPTPVTCKSAGANCGKISDGCGNLIECGKTCPEGETCGGGGKASVCGKPACTKVTCKGQGISCGSIGDGCGGELQCGDCNAPETCGGAGVHGKCGQSMTCVKQTCQDQGIACGPAGDLCGGNLNCGKCTAPDTCGGGGVQSQCGHGMMCVKNTCESLGLGCGAAGDGCGGSLDCGDCTAPASCGGGGVFGQCGSPTCVAQSCSDQGFTCGTQGDGCGGSLDCGDCPIGQTCGGGGTSNQCGAPACTSATCDAGDCGIKPDGCGNILSCGGCSLPATCGGGGTVGQCGVDPNCTNLCLQQVTCPAGQATTFTGTVYAPNGADPLPNVLVYVPNGSVQAFAPGVSCDNCASSVTGTPLVSALTDDHGNFQITNMPVGSNIPIVIQSGRWRKAFSITITGCTDNQTGILNESGTPVAQLNLPTTQLDGCPGAPAFCATNIPLMAFSTGSVDALECVIRKIGVQDSEFTAPGGAGRIQLFVGDGVCTHANRQGHCDGAGDIVTAPFYYDLFFGGANAPGQAAGSPVEDDLWGSTATLNQYDMVLLPCQGTELERGPNGGGQENLLAYANAGGRIFTTHFSYGWLYDESTFAGTAQWDINRVGQFANDPQTGYIDQTFPKGQTLANWLQFIGASTTLGQISLNTLRQDTDSVNNPPSQLWMTLQDPNQGTVPMHFTFNTPIGADPSVQCGRVLFDDFHVEDREYTPNTVLGNGYTGTYAYTFPAECDNNPMTAQEKLLEFMIFDLGSCVTPDNPVCPTLTCAQQGVGCGQAGDGCDDSVVLDCGPCPAGETCGGGGVASQCGSPPCMGETCAAQGIQCGPAGDGCGNPLDCGSCPVGQSCGGGGMPGKCGGGCLPETCAQQGIHCGPAGDGCGMSLDCGTCPPGKTCGGGGTPGVCGSGSCTAQTCKEQNIQCGPAGDGCGKSLDCGTCPAGETCGGGGTPGQCGGNSCVPLTCKGQGIDCGPAGDGCGMSLNCGTCGAGETCGGGGQPGKCGNNCKALTCGDQGFNCGSAGDGCGSTINCGMCSLPQTCGGGGVANVCGGGPK